MRHLFWKILGMIFYYIEFWAYKCYIKVSDRHMASMRKDLDNE